MPEKKQISKLDWYCPLYADPKLAVQKKRLVRKLNHNAVRPDLYLITFAANGQDLFDILSSAYLKQPALRDCGHCPGTGRSSGTGTADPGGDFTRDGGCRCKSLSA